PLLAIGMFWFGNERKLAHGNEARPLCLVQTLLALGLGALLARRRSAPAAWFAGGCGIAATMTFGAGAACFAAFVVVAWLLHAPRRQWLPLLASAALAAALLLLGNAGAEPATGFAPLDRLDQLLRWLGAPFVWLLHPLLASDHAARLPTDLLSAPAMLVAQPVEAAFGPSLGARWPAAAFGLLALLRLVWSTFRCRRDHDLAPQRTFALGLAWFGLGVGGLVVAARFHYFQQHPEQLTTARYVPWSMLLWTGLGLDFVLQPGRRARTANVLALACLVAFVPSSWWTGRAAWKRWRTAELTALGAAVGALDRDFPLVETRATDLLAAVPRLQALGAVMFVWPETKVLGERLPPERWQQLDHVDGLVVQATTNLFAGPCAAATFALPGTPIGRLLLVDADDVVVGLAMHCGPGHTCAGWLRREVTAAALRVGVLR
ncbi:MAG: hypothetical protein IT455_14290, partial [Planctomycetes bacterium]|nr:hypothetical protein [Planctomycetota bacterium]